MKKILWLCFSSLICTTVLAGAASSHGRWISATIKGKKMQCNNVKTFEHAEGANIHGFFDYGKVFCLQKNNKNKALWLASHHSSAETDDKGNTISQKEEYYLGEDCLFNKKNGWQCKKKTPLKQDDIQYKTDPKSVRYD